MTEPKELTFRVFRYKQGDSAPHYDSFTMMCDANTMLLAALQDIRRDHAPDLTLRHSCGHASCGTCGMKVNGSEQLACVVRVLELGSLTITVEPLEHIPLVSDLVVDMPDFFTRYAAPGMPYIRASEVNPEAELPEGVATYTRFENCLECGICVSACPVAGSDPEYLGPAALAAAGRIVTEPRGTDAAAALAWVDSEHGCWRCHVAFECSMACPSAVDPAGEIMGLRRRLTADRLRNIFSFDRK